MAKEPEVDDQSSDPLKPSLAVLAALGSIIVHYEEYTDEIGGGHPIDLAEARNQRDRPEVALWFQQMRNKTLLPLKRSGDTVLPSEEAATPVKGKGNKQPISRKKKSDGKQRPKTTRAKKAGRGRR